MRNIVWEHANYYQTQGSRWTRLIRKIWLIYADQYIVLTQRDLKNFHNNERFIRCQLDYIYNPYSVSPVNYRYLLDNKRIVSVGHVNNTFGTINDVKRIIDIAHSHNIPVLIDGAQSIAHTPVDVQALGADFFVFSGHKIYGPNGIGVVYGRKDLLDKMQPWQGGGNMIKDVTIERTEYNVPPARFEAGTPNVADAIGLGAALDYVSRLGIRNIEHHEHQLTEYAREQLAQIPGLTLIGNPRKRVSVVSFVLDGIPVPETGTLLDKEGIAVRAGHHCAQPALRALGFEMSVRPTFALYNTREDVDKLVIAIRKIIGR